MQRVLIRTLVFMLIISVLLSPGLSVQAADGGNGQVVSDPTLPPGAQLLSTINGMTIAFVKEYNKTSIFLRICANAPNFQMRSEDVGQWSTQIFNRTDTAGGCSPSTTSWWRMVYNIDPNTGETFRIYATANETWLSEAAFMQRAARTDCRVTAYGIGNCTPASPTPVVVPTGYIDAPSPNQPVQGNLGVGGWVIDAGSWNGTGISAVHIYVNSTFVGAATYGLSRSDVANAYGDSRFTNSGYNLTFNTGSLPNGPATLKVGYQSTLNGQWYWLEIPITINNTVADAPPNTPNQLSPANGNTTTNRSLTMTWQDTGDPDNGPRNYRDFNIAIRKSDGSWNQNSGWQTATSWTVTVPSDGTYYWKVQSGDGALASQWSSEWSMIVTTPASVGKTLDVRYVDQVYVQQVPENGYWNHCGPSSVAMVLYYEGKEQRDVLFNRQATLDLICGVKPKCSGGASQGMIVNTFKQRGLQVKQIIWNPSLNNLKQSIDSGHPVLMSIQQADHIVVAVGYDINTNTILINDPFGGKNWWIPISTSQRNDVINGKYISKPATPQLKGKNVSYSYGAGKELSGGYAIILNGPSPVLQALIASISRSSGGVLNGSGININFPPVANTQVSPMADTGLNVTYNPQLIPTHSTDGYAASIVAFQLDATDSNGQSVAQYDRPFSITVDLDPQVVDNLGISGGVTSADSSSVTSSISSPPIASLLTLAAWDNTAQQWVLLPSTVDLVNHKITAQTNQFTEFAVLVKNNHSVFLPVIKN